MKKIVLFVCISAFITCCFAGSDLKNKELLNIEKSFDGKIGVYALDTSTNNVIAYRSNELFPIQSTFKMVAVAALLKKADTDKSLLNKSIKYSKDDLVFWHPITGKHLNRGTMTLEELSEAAISYSDNASSNLIIKDLGGLEKTNNFAKSVGNNSFNLKNYEPNLNSNPSITDDTATPKDMALSVQKLLLGNILSKKSQERLFAWMKNNTTGNRKIRAGLPIAWSASEKTGGGDGVSNDIGIVWSPYCRPIVLSIYTVQNKDGMESRSEIISEITRTVLDIFSKTNNCFEATKI